METMLAALVSLGFAICSGGMVAYGLDEGEIYSKAPPWTKRSEDPTMFWMMVVFYCVFCSFSLFVFVGSVLKLAGV